MISYLRRTPLLHIVRNTTRLVHMSKYNTDKLFNEYYNTWKKQIDDILVTPHSITNETWENMRKHVMESKLDIRIPDSFILHMFLQQNCPDAGISYYKFLINNKYEVTVSTICLYLDLYNLKNEITNEDREYILSSCNKIMNEYSLLDQNLTNVVVTSLCKINKWKEAIELIHKFEKNDNLIPRAAYTSLIKYLYDNDNINLGYEYLIRSFKTGIGPHHAAYSAYINYYLREKHEFNVNIEKLFKLWNKYGVKPSVETISEYIRICNSIGWTTSETVVLRGKCLTCEQQLLGSTLTDQEFQYLRNITMKELFLNKMYYATNPQEIKSYMKFIDKNKPYDVVIDGLNVFHFKKSNIRNSLLNYLKSCKEHNKKVLVIGRDHMKKVVKAMKAEDLAQYFYVKNWSTDDAFVLYAAFSSGKDVIVISNDFMRDHKSAISDVELSILFKKWQSSQQHTIEKVQDSTNTLFTQVQFDAIVQKQNSCWHIPFIQNLRIPSKRHKDTDYWACFKMPK